MTKTKLISEDVTSTGVSHDKLYTSCTHLHQLMHMMFTLKTISLLSHFNIELMWCKDLINMFKMFNLTGSLRKRQRTKSEAFQKCLYWSLNELFKYCLGVFYCKAIKQKLYLWWTVSRPFFQMSTIVL